MSEPIRIGIIGGSGLYKMNALTDIREVTLSTPFGDPSDAIIIGKIRGIPVAFLPRHGRGHILNPTEVPYRANIYALKWLGVEYVVAVSACGSLQEELAPGHIVIPDQLFDFTKGIRAHTFYENGLVAHTSVAHPFCEDMRPLLAQATQEAGGMVHFGGNFITIEGPRFSTKIESQMYRSWGMDIIGMTTSPEAFLAREADMCYAVMAHVTDYDVWHESEVTAEMVLRTMSNNLGLAQESILKLIPKLANLPARTGNQAFAAALTTSRNAINPEQYDKLKIIIEQ